MVETNFHEDITNGPGIWCFRNTLLNDKDFVEIMRKEIKDFIKQLPDYKDKFEFWEEFYVLVRVTAQDYSREKNKRFKNEMIEVTTEINDNKGNAATATLLKRKLIKRNLSRL